MSAFDSSVPVWPKALAPRHICSPVLVKPVMEGPQPLTGTPQTVQSNSGFWQMQLVEIPIHYRMLAGASGADRLSQWRVFYNGYLANGIPIYMRAFDWNRGPRARAGLTLFGPLGSPTDGSTYTQSLADVTVVTAAAAQTNTLVVNIATAATPAAGDFFSLGDRLYQIIATAAVGGHPTQSSWTITPPLRYAASVSDGVEIADPICKMVMSPKDRSQLVQMEFGMVGNPTVTFNEANWA